MSRPNFFCIGRMPCSWSCSPRVYTGKQYPPGFQPTSTPVRSSQVVNTSRLFWHSRIFAGSEWVARTPPMAALFEPWPGEA